MKRIIISISILLFSVYAFGQDQEKEESMSNEDIAKASQNPLAAMYSIPIQNNINMNLGRGDLPGYPAKNMANFQPVIPLSLGSKVDVIMRLIMPIVTAPPVLTDGSVSTTGIGDLTLTAFFAPKKVKKLIWGVGPVLYFPTATNEFLGGTKKWAAGPALVMLLPMGKLNAGFLLMNFWSFAGSNEVIDGTFSFMQIQPFINYNLNDGWFVTTVPIMTANWSLEKGNQWTVPVGGGIGKAFKLFGALPVSAQIHSYYAIISPDPIGEKWQIRIQAQIFLPRKSKKK